MSSGRRFPFVARVDAITRGERAETPSPVGRANGDRGMICSSYALALKTCIPAGRAGDEPAGDAHVHRRGKASLRGRPESRRVRQFLIARRHKTDAVDVAQRREHLRFASSFTCCYCPNIF